MAKAIVRTPSDYRGGGARTASEHPFFSRLKNEKVMEFLARVQEEVSILTNELIDTTPIDTGAAAGVKSNSVSTAKRAIYPGHPAFGSGGIRGGKLGWYYERKNRRNQVYEFNIMNPMWDAYLQYVEYLHPRDAGFVARAWYNHRQRVGAGLMANTGAMKYRKSGLSSASYNPGG